MIAIKLKRGIYLAPESKNYDAQGVLAATTSYPQPVSPGVWHCHENPMFCFVLKGGNIEKRKAVEFERTPGLVTFYHAGELHQNIYKVFPSKGFNLELEKTFFDRYDVSEDAFARSVVNKAENQFALYRLYWEFVLQDASSIASSHMLLLSMIGNSDDKKMAEQIPSWVKVVLEVLNDQWNEDPSLEKLALICGVHPITISKHFPKYVKCTLGNYVRRLRVQKAIEIIHSSELSLSTIAHQCGFSDQSHFIRIFKHYTGLLPKQIRKI